VDELPPWVGTLKEGTTTSDEGTTTDEQEGTTDSDDDVEEGVPVQPVQAKGIGDVRKMVPGHGTGKEGVVVPSGEVVPGHGTKNGGTGGGKGDGGSGGVTDVPPPKERVSLAKHLVEVERKPASKAREPNMRAAITLAQKELVMHMQKKM
jgi:hypothetical protein